MGNVLSDEKQKQVIALGKLGWTLRRIEKATGVRRETAAEYLREAGVAVRPPGGWGRLPPAKPANEVTADLAPVPEPDSAKPANGVTTGSASICAAYGEIVESELVRGRNAMAIWQDLVDRHGFTGAYESVKRYVRKLRGFQGPEACAIIITAPGEEAQVDYGEGPMVLDPATGKHRRTRLFVLTLGYSRKAVRLLVFQSGSRVWAELHEKAFLRLGGSPHVVVLDNLREGVLKPDIYDPTLNPLYCDMLAHYGAVALPCRAGDPDRKGKVESGVAHAQKTPLKGQKFDSLEQAQAYLDHWEAHWADTRIHGTTKRQVAAMFAEEKPLLQPLPAEPFRYYQHGERTVHLDGCVEVEAAYYSTPPGWIGQRVHVQWDALHVRILNPSSGQLLREHLRQQRGRHRIHEADRSRKTPRGILELLVRAETSGQQTGKLCRHLHETEGDASVRRILGVLSLRKKYGAARVEDACAAAFELGVVNYPFLRRYLERHAEPPVSLRQVDPLIRQLTLYRDLIEQRTQEPQP